jgi:hypothetical protein
VSGSCAGTADASVKMESGGAEGAKHLAGLRIGLLGGMTAFLGNKNTLFRTGVDEDHDYASMGPRFELRLGFRLGSYLTLEAIAGGARRAFTYWNDCSSGSDCLIDFPAVNTMDFGAMLQAHTNPSREFGHLDFYAGVGVRPWTRILLNDVNTGSARLTSTVIPAEVGVSIFLGSGLSLDVRGQGEFWIPWNYCDTSTDECTDAVHEELGWSALAGLTFHIH